MPDELKRPHITTAELIEYFDKDLLEDEEDQLELHLARCEECAQRARKASALSDVWEQWSAKTYSEAFLRAVIRNALESAAVGELEDDTWKERILRWHSAAAGLAEGAVRVAIEAARNASQIVTEGMENLLRREAAWQFNLQTEPVAVRGPASGRKAPPKIAVAKGTDASLARVKVEDHDDKTREIVISVNLFPRNKPAPLVMLTTIESRGKGKPRILQMRRQGQGLIARFKDLPAAEFLVVLEPSSTAGAL